MTAQLLVFSDPVKENLDGGFAELGDLPGITITFPDPDGPGPCSIWVATSWIRRQDSDPVHTCAELCGTGEWEAIGGRPEDGIFVAVNADQTHAANFFRGMMGPNADGPWGRA